MRPQCARFLSMTVRDTERGSVLCWQPDLRLVKTATTLYSTAFLRAQSTVTIVLGGAGKSHTSAGLSMALRNVPRRALSPAGEPILINWRRGLFRIWLLASAGWVMGWTIHLIMYSLRGGYSGNTDFVAIPILLLAPPLALFMFGLATGWAFRGFQAKDDKRSPRRVRESNTA
jgi:hypothetical protein